MWYTSGKHRALKSVWSPRAAERNHYWKREERGELNNWTCLLESAIEKLNPEVFKIYFLPKFWISGGWVEIWTIRHGSWWSFEEERVEGEQKNKILNNQITMQSIAGISKWHKESLEAEKMWKQLCEVTLSYQMDQQSLKWNPRKYQSVLGRKFTTLKHNIAIAVEMQMNVSNCKNAISFLFLRNRNWGVGKISHILHGGSSYLDCLRDSFKMGSSLSFILHAFEFIRHLTLTSPLLCYLLWNMFRGWQLNDYYNRELKWRKPKKQSMTKIREAIKND